MKNKITLKIYSLDGKSFIDEVDALYLNVPDYGVIGLMPNHTPYTAMLEIATFYIVKKQRKTFFAVSGGTIDFKNGQAIILALTFEKESELDRERIEKSKAEALKKLKTIDKNDSEAYENANFALKKAINRLKILK